MDKEFVPYEQALALKELGFDEPCFAYYLVGGIRFKEYKDSKNKNSAFYNNTVCSAPMFQQAFRWFKEKYNLHHSISILQRSCRYHFKIRTIECESDLKPFGDNKIIFEDGPRKKYEDIELDCLKKLIEIVKDGKK